MAIAGIRKEAGKDRAWGRPAAGKLPGRPVETQEVSAHGGYTQRLWGEYERLVDELLDNFSDKELGGGATGPRVLFRINAEAFPEAALIFDPVTGAKQKVRVPIAGAEAA